jgi:hypothetical protein
MVQETQPDPLTRRKCDRPMPAVVDGLIVLLCLLQAIPDLGQKLISVPHCLADHRQPSVTNHLRTNRRRRTPIHQLEG